MRSVVDLIFVPCEGSGSTTHHLDIALLRGAPVGDLCRTCGRAVEIDGEGIAAEHDRLDVLTMLARGAFR